MPRGQHKNIINNSQDNMAPPEPSYSTTASSEHSDTVEAQENNLKINFMKRMEVLKEEINKLPKEIQEKNKQ